MLNNKTTLIHACAWLLLSFLLLPTISSAQTDHTAPTLANRPLKPNPKYALPIRTTPQAFWAKIVRFLDKTDGYVTHEKFEKEFGVKMRRSQDGTNFWVEEGVDWYFYTHLEENVVNYIDYTGSTSDHPIARNVMGSGLRMEWPESAFGSKPGEYHCIHADEAIQSLLDSGWKMVAQPAFMLTAELQFDYLVRKDSEHNAISIYHYHFKDLLGYQDESNSVCMTKIRVNGQPDLALH